MLKLPPYGKIISSHLTDHLKLKVPIYIFVGKEAFQVCKLHKAYAALATCLPYNDSYFLYEWPVKDQCVVLSDTGGCELIDLQKFIYHLLSTSHAKSIAFDSDLAPFEVFTKGILVNDK